MKALLIMKNGVIYIPSPIELCIVLGLIPLVYAYCYYRKCKRNARRRKMPF